MRHLLPRTLGLTLAAAALAACGEEPEVVPGTAGGDPDVAVTPTGLPAGYEVRLDRPGQAVSEVSYVPRGEGWEVRTGPAHILWEPADTASGTYTVRTTVRQLEAPAHPEAYGLFVGGQDLAGASPRYTYFLVRGGGEYLVRVREGDSTRTVTNWTRNPAIPVQDSAGVATYPIAVAVGADSVRFLVDGTPVAAVARAAVPTDGVYGLRINHNLRVEAQPVVVER